jgi:NAD(P)-dependent dehydrogenase (short-subunit alcohol dehydrogenase family)
VDRFADDVAVVTGSTRGVGRGVVRRLAAEGATVVVNDEGTDRGPRVVERLREAGATASYVAADVRDPGAVGRLVETSADRHGGVDVLVNNVGENRPRDPTDASLDDWAFVLETNLRAA